jgi:low affinity Fe/Cu permease
MVGTLVTLFLLLIMQHSQNRDMAALQVKVDELIRSSEAGNHMIGVERLEAEELARLADNKTL